MVFIRWSTCKQHFSSVHPVLSGTPCVMNAVYSAALFVVKRGKKAVSCASLQHASAVEEGTAPPAVLLHKKPCPTSCSTSR